MEQREKEGWDMIIAVWSPAGSNTAQLSMDLSGELAKSFRVLLVELPCLGIPRLGFITNIMDREKHTEAAILEMEKKGELSLDYLHTKTEGLAILPANVFASPDFPVSIKVETETLIDFPVAMTRTAYKKGYSTVVFECQGQMTSPMTFFALKHAQHILIPVKEPGEIAFSLINVKRMVQVFKLCPEVFLFVARIDEDIIREVAVLKDDEGRVLNNLRVVGEDVRQIIKTLIPGRRNSWDGVRNKEQRRTFSLHLGQEKKQIFRI